MNNKTLVKQKASTLAHPGQTQAPLMSYKKTLNLKLIFSILVLNIITVVATFHFVSNENLNKSDLEKLKLTLLEELHSQNSDKVITINHNESELSRLREQIREEVNSINLKYVELSEKREKFYEKLIHKIVERKPASVSLSEPEGVLTYSSVNEDILRDKQRITEDRLYSDLKKEEQKLLATLNLKDPKEQRVLELFQDEMKVKMAELKTQHYHDLLKFRKDKFLIVNN